MARGGWLNSHDHGERKVPRTLAVKSSIFSIGNYRKYIQGGPLPVISGVISPINGLING